MRLNLSTPPSTPLDEASVLLVCLIVAAIEWAHAEGHIPERGVDAARLVGANVRAMTIPKRERFARSMLDVLLSHTAGVSGLLLVRMGETAPVVEYHEHITSAAGVTHVA